MADISNITLPNEENYDIKDKAARNDIAINRTTLGVQCKNLLKNTAVTTTINGVTFTVNSDGSITATQTTTSTGNATIKVATMTLKPGTYILTGDDEIKKSGFGEIRFYVGSTIYSSNKPHTFDTEVTINVRLFVWRGVNINGSKTIYPMLRYADITDDTYEPYQPSVQEQINNFGTQQQLLCDYSSSATSSVTIQITGLFSNYSAVICIVKYSYGTTSFTLPLKYIKSIGKSKEYSPVLDLGFRYVDDNNLLIGGADAAISSVKIISLY